MKNYFVTRKNGQWSVKKGGASRASRNFSTQKEAINFGKKLAKNANSELTIQGRDGKFREGYRYGNDPYPPKG